jgi:hypothetical protein
VIQNSDIRRLVAEQASSTPIDAYKSIQYRFESSRESTDARLRAADFLAQLNKCLVETLKNLSEADELDAYTSTLRDWAQARGRQELDHRLDDLQFHATHADRDTRRRVEREIGELKPLADAAAQTSETRGSGFIQLGGWLAARLRQDPEHGDHLRYLKPLIGEVDRETVIAVLNRYFAEHSFDLLGNWHSQEMIASGASSWSGDRSADGLYWGALLLLVKTPPDTRIDVPASPNVSSASTQIQAQLRAVVNDAPLWADLLPTDDLDARLSNIEAAWKDAERVQREVERVAITDAQLNTEVVDAFRRGNQEAFETAQAVGNAFNRLGHRSRIKSSSAFDNGGRIVREVFPKSWFIEDRHVGGLNENIGTEFARDQDQLLFSQLLSQAAREPQPVGPQLGSLISAVRSLSEEVANRAIVLAPDHYILRERIWEAPGFKHEADRRAFGVLAGAPVFLVPGPERQPLVLLDLRHGELTEFVAEGQQSPLWIQVKTLDFESASEEVTKGFRFADEPEMSNDEVANKLASERVLVNALLSWDLRFDSVGIHKFTWEEGELAS